MSKSRSGISARTMRTARTYFAAGCFVSASYVDIRFPAQIPTPPSRFTYLCAVDLGHGVARLGVRVRQRVVHRLADRQTEGERGWMLCVRMGLCDDGGRSVCMCMGAFEMVRGGGGAAPVAINPPPNSNPPGRPPRGPSRSPSAAGFSARRPPSRSAGRPPSPRAACSVRGCC